MKTKSKFNKVESSVYFPMNELKVGEIGVTEDGIVVICSGKDESKVVLYGNTICGIGTYFTSGCIDEVRYLLPGESITLGVTS